ncbi:hypothetical protein KP509_1Z002900 [Ceratopteris richardii]|nr:hypothetical protein KP509_1Z002900 [Ceratopteris richardii]
MESRLWGEGGVETPRRLGHGEAGDSGQSTTDLKSFVQNLLQQMQSRFQTMSESIITKIDEMGSRIDDLEKSISDVTKEMGVELPTSKPGSDDKPE